MPNKKTFYADDEIPIFDEAVIYKRGEYWQMRMWLAKERKYARFSLKTRNRDIPSSIFMRFFMLVRLPASVYQVKNLF